MTDRPLPARADRLLRRLRRIDYRNLGMATRTLRVLARPRARNWWYNRAFLKELPLGLYRALFDPNAMNDFQRVRAEDGAVSTPADGLCAGVTERGRVSALFGPYTGFTNQIPYHVHDDEDHLKGAKPRDGAFFGVRFAGGEGEADDQGSGPVVWLWEPAFDHEMRPVPETGTLELRATTRAGSPADLPAGAALDATEHLHVAPGTETLVRDLTIRNEGSVPVESAVYYTHANANANLQYPPGVTCPNRIVAREDLRWVDETDGTEVRVRADPDATVLDSGVTTGPLDRLFADSVSRETGHYVGGFLEIECSVAPGEEATTSTFTTVRGGDGVQEERPPADAVDDRLSGPVDARRERSHDWWAEQLSAADLGDVPDEHAAGARRAVVDLLTLCDPGSGSISAAPHVQPAYYFSWPRDGAFTAVALARVGVTEPAEQFLADFLPPLVRADGSFEQCYASNGAPAGVIPVENDQQPAYVWAVRETYDALPDSEQEAFLAVTWPTVRAVSDYTLDAIADNDLLAATHDYAEMWTDADQSIWTNTLAYRGLHDAAALARSAANAGVLSSDAATASAERFEAAADRIGDAIDREFFDVDAPVGRLSSGAEPASGWNPVGEFATHRTVTGPEQRPTTIAAIAAYPTEWADDYGRSGELLDALESVYDATPTRWLPKEFLYAAACYRAGDREAGDRVLADLGDERLPGGAFAEEVGPDGDHAFAALGWSSAMFLLALDERRRAGDKGDKGDGSDSTDDR